MIGGRQRLWIKCQAEFVLSKLPRDFQRTCWDDPLNRHSVLADLVYESLCTGKVGLSRPVHCMINIYQRIVFADLLRNDPLYIHIYIYLYIYIYIYIYIGALVCTATRCTLIYFVYRRSALDTDWRLLSLVWSRLPICACSTYSDLILSRPSANFDAASLNRELMYDLDNVARSRTASGNILTGTLA